MTLDRLKFFLGLMVAVIGFSFLPTPALAQYGSGAAADQALRNAAALNVSTQCATGGYSGSRCSAEDTAEINRYRQALGTTNGVSNACLANSALCTQAERTTVAQQKQANSTVSSNTELSCNVINIDACLVLLTYYVGPGLASKIAYVGAYFFSYMINFSLNSTAYALNFLSEMWTVVRDLANMAFIFILIYISILVMLRSETAGTVKMLAAVIVVALLVNFSFFFTRVAIDAGNIVAVQIYNAIPYGSNPQTAVIGNSGVKDLSVSLMDSLKVQSLLNTENFKRIQTLSDGAGGFSGKSAGVIMYMFIFLFAAATFWLLFFVFLQVGIKFLLRIVGLWMILIASPAAFIAAAVPNGKPFFKMWYEKLFYYSVYPAIFLFMFLILTKFVTSMLAQQSGGNILAAIFNPAAGTATNADAQLGFLNVVAGVGIRLAFMMALLYIGLKVADMVVKEGTAVAGKFTGWTTGKVFGVGAGVAGWTARKTIGRGFNALAKNPDLAAVANRPGIKGLPFKGIERFSKYLGNATYDVRNAPGGSILSKGVSKILGTAPVTGKAAAEGYTSIKKAQEEKAERAQKERERRIKEAAQEKRAEEMLKSQQERDKEFREVLEKISKNTNSGGADDIKDVERARRRTKSEIEKYSAKTHIDTAHTLSEDQLKAITESTQYAEKEKEQIAQIARPIINSQRIVQNELREVNDHLSVMTSLSLNKYTAQGAIINTSAVNEMRDDLFGMLREINQQIRNAPPNEDKTDLLADKAVLQNSIRSVKKLSKQIDKIPKNGTRPEKEHVVT